MPRDHILVLGDFSGGATSAASRAPLAARRVEADTMDTALGAVGPRLDIRLDAPLRIEESLTFSTLDDFHPDRLITRCAALRTLRELCARLANGATAEQALRALEELAPHTEAPAHAPPAEPARESGGELLARLLGNAPRATERTSRTVAGLIASAFSDTGPQSPPGAAPAKRRAEELTTLTLRALLAEPSFKALEAAWRGVHWLVTELDEEQATVSLVDLPQAALELPAGGLEQTPLVRLLAAERDEPFTLIVGLYSFGRNLDDLMLLAKLGAIAARAGATFLARGSLALCGCDSLEAADRPRDWHSPDDATASFYADLREHRAAQSLVLAAPRFVLRHPYGARSNPVEALDFEELPARPDQERFLWGSPALLAAFAVASESDRIAGLPMPLYDDGTGGKAQQLPLEASLGEEAAARAAAAGFSVLRCNRRTGEVIASVRALANDRR